MRTRPLKNGKECLYESRLCLCLILCFDEKLRRGDTAAAASSCKFSLYKVWEVIRRSLQLSLLYL
jgi:hypothetical protein